MSYDELETNCCNAPISVSYCETCRDDHETCQECQEFVYPYDSENGGCHPRNL